MGDGSNSTMQTGHLVPFEWSRPMVGDPFWHPSGLLTPTAVDLKSLLKQHKFSATILAVC